jgi:hypothetical protein
MTDVFAYAACAGGIRNIEVPKTKKITASKLFLLA